MHRLRFVVELIGCAAIGALAGVVFRHNDDLLFATLILGFGLCVAFFVHLAIGLRARWRFHYVTICRFFGLLLAALICFAVVAINTDKADKQAARDYLERIKPQLDDYRQSKGHYPDALGEIPGLPAPPADFVYHREKDSLPENPDTYRIDYYSMEYWSGSGEWFDDD